MTTPVSQALSQTALFDFLNEPTRSTSTTSTASESSSVSPPPQAFEYSTSPSEAGSLSQSVSPITISPQPLKGRVSPYKEILEKALEYYAGCSDHAVAVCISDVIDLIVSITDSFLIEDLPDSWVARFTRIQKEVVPTKMSKIKFTRLRAPSQRDLVKMFFQKSLNGRDVQIIEMI